MRRHEGALRRTTTIFVAILLPAVAGFWYILGGFFADTAASSAARTRAAVMNQADRLAFDLDLELTLLESYLTSGGAREFFAEDGAYGDASSSPRVKASVEAYARAARWPTLVSALYVLEPLEGGEGVKATKVLPGDGEGVDYGELVATEYADAFAPNPAIDPDDGKDDAVLTRAVWLFDDMHNPERAKLLIAVLNEAVLAQTIIPALVAKYFGEGTAFEDYAVEVFDPTGLRRFSSEDRELRGGREADFSRPLLRDTTRFDVLRFYSSFAPSPDAPGRRADGLPRPLGERPAMPDAPSSPGTFLIDRYRFQSMDLKGVWTLRVSGRKLPIALATTRQTVLWSLAAAGFLGLLYGSVVMMFVSGRKALYLAAKERDFVASVTHELKTPIAVALSAGENLAKGIIPMERVAEYGSIVAKEARRLGESVERLLVMAGLESAQPLRRGEPVAVESMIRAAVSKLSYAAEQRRASVEVCVAGAPFVDGSRVLIESAIECVVSNAVKYAGGAIIVSAREERRGKRSYAVVTCTDKGPGAPRSERRRLFDAFYRGRAATEDGIQGTGIGLYLAKRITSLHGGDARLRFPAEGGTVAELTFRSSV